MNAFPLACFQASLTLVCIVACLALQYVSYLGVKGVALFIYASYGMVPMGLWTISRDMAQARGSASLPGARQPAVALASGSGGSGSGSGSSQVLGGKRRAGATGGRNAKSTRAATRAEDACMSGTGDEPGCAAAAKAGWDPVWMLPLVGSVLQLIAHACTVLGAELSGQGLAACLQHPLSRMRHGQLAAMLLAMLHCLPPAARTQRCMDSWYAALPRKLLVVPADLVRLKEQAQGWTRLLAHAAPASAVPAAVALVSPAVAGEMPAAISGSSSSSGSSSVAGVPVASGSTAAQGLQARLAGELMQMLAHGTVITSHEELDRYEMRVAVFLAEKLASADGVKLAAERPRAASKSVLGLNPLAQLDAAMLNISQADVSARKITREQPGRQAGAWSSQAGAHDGALPAERGGNSA